MPDEDLGNCIERMDRLLSKIESLPDPSVRGDVQEIVQCLLKYHGVALARLLGILQHEQSNAVKQLADDELVASLLLLHNLHPDDIEARVMDALERVRPFLGSHGGDVTLLGISRGIVRLKLDGNCDGCPSSAATLKSRIEQAIYESAPDVVAIEVDGNHTVSTLANGFVPIETLSAR